MGKSTMTEASNESNGRALTKKEEKESKMTKRQRRKQVNEKQAWPQHPKIQSPAARASAYLRTAGLGKNAKSNKDIDPALDLHSPQMKFGRLLGGTDQRARHQAVLQLSAYLKARCDINNEGGGLSELDLLKLWKGLWHTLYMADRVPVQDELSAKIAGLIWCVAGNEEEDEFAGKAYLDMYGDEGDSEFEDENDEEEGDGDNEGDESEGDDDDDSEDAEDVEMLEIANTMGDDEEEEASDESSRGEDPEGSDEENGMEGMEGLEELDDSEIPHCRGAHLASLFVRTFFRTVRREWGRMDKYRVDKFYMLMRLMMREVYTYMAVRHWNLGIIRLFNDAIYEEILSKTPNGLRYHLIDISLDELARVHAQAPMPLTEATFLDCMEPFFAMAQTGAGGDDICQERAVENVLEKFLVQYSVVSQRVVEDAEEDEDEDEVPVFSQVHVGTVSQFIFNIASDGATSGRYRKSLYTLHKKYARRLKQTGIDVDIGNGDAAEAALEEREPDEDSAEEVEETPVEPVVEKKSGKKKRKKEKKAAPPKEESDEEQPPAKSKDSKKKKKRKSSEPVEEEGEEEVTISLNTQKSAKQAMQAKDKPNPKEREKVVDVGKKSKKKRKTAESAEEANKRVSFGDRNHSRSWKASMKGLRTMEVPPTPDVTPEKSILLKKAVAVRKTKTSKKKVKRAKAIDYF